MNGRVTIHFAVKSRQNIVGNAPRLGFIVADIPHVQTGFFHNFPFYSFLQRFADFGEAGNQCEIGKSGAVFGQQQRIP